MLLSIMPKYYTKSGQKIRNPKAYAKSGAPMYHTKYSNSRNINRLTCIYKLDLESGKKYIGKTSNFGRRMKQHFSGNGAKVTKKFRPIKGKVIDSVYGFFSSEVEQYHTKEYMDKHGYANVRGGRYTNSKTLRRTPSNHQVTCFKCGGSGHYANNCYS